MKYMIIENNIDLIKFYEQVGIDRIFLDLEVLGKQKRQGHLDTVISFNHSISDISRIKPVLSNSKLLVRINPINNNTKDEIERCILDGADIIMLPMFKTAKEVEYFIKLINGRVKTCLLLETAEAMCRIDDVLLINGIDEIHIGLNDLHLSLKLEFMFELLTGGIIEYLIKKIQNSGIRYGIGGIATCDGGLIKGKMILGEYARLGSSQVILSRVFKQIVENNRDDFVRELNALKDSFLMWRGASANELEKNKLLLKDAVFHIVSNK